MKRISKLTLLMLATTALICSCVKAQFDPTPDPPTPDDPVEIYKSSFKKYVGGEISSSQVWGFYNNISATTRAADPATVTVNTSDYSSELTKNYFSTIQEYFKEGEACVDATYRSYEFNRKLESNRVDIIYSNITTDDVVGIYYYDPATETVADAAKVEMVSDLKTNTSYYMQYSWYSSGSEWVANMPADAGYKPWTEWGAQRLHVRRFTITMNPSYRYGFYVYNPTTGKTYYSNKYLNENEAELGGLIGYQNVGYVEDSYVFGLSDDDRPGCEILFAMSRSGSEAVSPEKPEPKLEWKRIICEDLNVTNNDTDFDFNDIVLDVALVDGGAQCVLQAAGATLKIRINRNDELEVHKMFGVDQKVMVNTDAEKHGMSGATKDPVKFKLEGSFSSINDIAIEVFRNNRWIEMTAPPADAASKIAVDDMNFEWPYERQSIKTKYPDFPVYATKNAKPDSWWK